MAIAEVLRQQIAAMKERRSRIVEGLARLSGAEARDAETELRVLERAISTQEDKLRELLREK
jgi:hypothetical protein